MKVNNPMFLVQFLDHIYEGNVTNSYFLSKIQIKIENLDRASGVQDRNRGLDEHFPKKFRKLSYLDLMMVFKVFGSSRMSFEALTASLTLTSVLVRSKSRLKSLRVLGCRS